MIPDDPTQGDLSPMLSHPAHADNAPMISGRGTKIIADARGAYMAGSLRGLFARMSDTQKAKFRAAVLGQAMHYLEIALPDSYSSCLNLLRQQIDQSTSDVVDQVMRFLFDLGVLDYENDSLEYRDERAVAITLLAVAIQEGNILRIADSVRSIPSTMEHHRRQSETDPPPETAKASPRRWQIEAAWSILQGRDVPPIATFLSRLTDEQREYHRGDLKALAERLSAEQKEHLIGLFIEQTLTLRYEMRYGERQSTVIHHLSEMRRQWRQSRAHNQGPGDGELLSAHINRYLLTTDLRLHDLRLIASSDDLVQIAAWGTSTLAALLADESFRSDNHLLIQLHWWQIEVTWAAVQGRDLPAFLPQG